MPFDSLWLYEFLARFFPKSFFAKLALVTIVAACVPLLALGAYLAFAANFSNDIKWQIFLSALAVSMLGAVLALFSIYFLFAPVRFTVKSLQKYIEQQVVPTLPTTYSDLPGQLMADVQHVVGRLDRHATGVENLAQIDHLTRMLNRGASETRLRQDMEYAISHLQPFALALLDLDHFKQINDHYGLLIGDQCMRHIAHVIRDNIRKDDWLGRWGGDEFILVLRDIEPQRLRQALMRLNDAMQASPNPDLPTDMHLMISISVGATILRPGDTPEALLSKADAALYRSKMEGRGQVTVLDERVNAPTKKPAPANAVKKS